MKQPFARMDSALERSTEIGGGGVKVLERLSRPF